MKSEQKAAEIKIYLKSKILNSWSKHTIINIKKNLKNIIDFVKLIKLACLPSSKYKASIRLRLDEKKIIQNNKKIIFVEKSNLVFKIFDFNWKIPKQQNNTTFRLIIKLPRIKLIGKKPKIMFVNRVGLILKFFLYKVILFLIIPQ